MNKNCFDFLRFFFAFNILLAHLCELSQSTALSFLSSVSNSSIAVKGFFIISGFLVTKSYRNTPSLKEYFMKRIKRILPAYVTVLLISTLVLSFFSSYSFIEYFTDINIYKYLGWNLLFLNFMHPCLPGLFENNLYCVINGSLWTLKVEEGFYVVLPIIFFIITKIKKPLLILGSLYILSILYWFVMDFYFDNPVLAKQLPGYLVYFVTGVFLYLNFDFVLQHKTQLLLAALFLTMFFNFSIFQIDLLYPLTFGVIVITAAYSFPFLNNFGKYGDFTYGMYIYHFPIIQLFRQYNLFGRFNPILMAILVIFITFLFAVFSWFVIEKRFLNRYKSNVQLAIS
ncbi:MULTISPECIES: acyltransferase family protein [unclassified Flavobacterium]|uniref:acyltransferase family protein n=1 Tax=unclassified Flavobacterium TaxID=196869 RepID=UPI003F8E3E38